MRVKKPEAWTNNTWMLHHDNAPAHASLLSLEFLTKHETTLVPQPPYSPDLPPCGIFLVPEVGILTKRSLTSDGRGDRRKFDRHLRAIPQNTFQDSFQNWKKRWEQCIKSGAEYFEGDKFKL